MSFLVASWRPPQSIIIIIFISDMQQQCQQYRINYTVGGLPEKLMLTDWPRVAAAVAADTAAHWRCRSDGCRLGRRRRCCCCRCV